MITYIHNHPHTSSYPVQQDADLDSAWIFDDSVDGIQYNSSCSTIMYSSTDVFDVFHYFSITSYVFFFSLSVTRLWQVFSSSITNYYSSSLQHFHASSAALPSTALRFPGTPPVKPVEATAQRPSNAERMPREPLSRRDIAEGGDGEKAPKNEERKR